MYATVEDIRKRTDSAFSDELCETLLNDAAAIIDLYNDEADEEIKKIVSCRMVIRALPNSDESMPIGANQGTISALGYSQTWTMSQGATVGELYLNKLEKKMLGCASKVGSHSPIECL